MKYALITGASSGIGYETSKELARRGYHVIIVGRQLERLKRLKKKIKERYRRRVIIIRKDLSNIDDVYKLYDKAKKYKPEVVINNAGLATYGDFLDSSIGFDLNIINLNIICVHLLTKLFLKDMVKKNKGRIMNTSSISAFQPVPNMAVYTATKAYLLHLTEAIAKELEMKHSKVTLTALCPGGTATGFNERAGLNMAPAIRIGQVPAKFVAIYGVKCMLQGKTIAIPGIIPNIFANLSRFLTRKAMRNFVYCLFKNPNMDKK